MSRSPFDPEIGDLPATLPIFPLSGVLLLPRGRLPLNIFEPRYLNMTVDALAGRRMIGMVQPCTSNGSVAGGGVGVGSGSGGEPAVFPTGCAGRITSFAETDDGRFLITLTGVIRFHITSELATTRGYRRITPRYEGFEGDLVDPDGEGSGAPDGRTQEGMRKEGLGRARLLQALRQYFTQQGMTANWEVIADTPDDRLITTLAMVCPFEPQEKQALLEAPTLADRAKLMLALLEMALHERPSPSDMPRH